MTDERPDASVLNRLTTRRALLGGALAAGTLGAAYAAFGSDLFGDGSGDGQDANVYNEGKALDQESVRISHLLRRTGFGVTAEEHARYQALGLKATQDELINYGSINDDAAIALANQTPVTATSPVTVPITWWMVRMASTTRPLQEKMTLFWHGLLTSQISVVRDPTAMIAQNEFFRAHAFDAFPDILKGISRDPGMLVYLDTAGSTRAAPNENYARELMELFALGVGNYTEQDVREASKAFTGWQVPRTRIDANNFTLEQPVFALNRFDNGNKTFLGKTGNFRDTDIVDIIVQQPASAKYIVRRLFSFFIYQDPTDSEIQPFVDVYQRSERKIGPVVDAMLRSEVFYSPKAYRSMVKSPVEYVISALKALGLHTGLGQTLTSLNPRNGGASLAAMNQTPFEPPNVAGWPGGANWLNSATMFARLNFLNQVTSPNLGVRQPANRPAQPAQALPGSEQLGTAAQALAHYLPMTLDDNVPQQARQVLIDYAGGDAAPLTADTLRSLVYLILGSPQFHLA